MTEGINSDTFRALVDSASDPCAAAIDNLYEHYQACSSAFLTVPPDAHRQIIRSALETSSGLSWYDLKALQRELIFDSVLYSHSLEPYFSILSMIKGVFRENGRAYPLSEAIRWSDAITVAKAYNTDYPGDYCLDEARMRRHYCREYNVAEAAKRLSLAGFGFIRVGGLIRMGADEVRRIGERIESLRQQIDGTTFGRVLFQALLSRYDHSLERYGLGRDLSSVGRDRPASIPVGYLFQLAAKSIGHKAESERPHPEAIVDLVNLACDLATLYDAEPYLTIEALAIADVEIPSFLRDVVLFDQVFTTSQLRPSHASTIVRYLFAPVNDPAIQRELGFAIDDYLNVMDTIFKLVRFLRGPATLRVEDVVSSTGIELRTLENVLGVLAHSQGSVNREYLLPSDADKANYMFRPLVRTSASDLALLDGTCNAPAFYEALAARLRELGLNVEQRVGVGVEALVHQQFSQHNIPVIRGKYRAAGVNGECDAVIASRETLMFLELKKKALTRASKSGDPVQVLIDLSRSLVDCQLQLGGHEILIRREGRIQFEGGQVLELDGRGIERIALTLFDFGGLQDRLVLKHFLNLMTRASFEADSPLDAEKKRGFMELQESCLSLYKQLEHLTAVQAVERQGPFFHCWFLSVPQLLTLLENVSSAEEFRDNLWTCRYSTTSRLDFYQEYSFFKALKQSGMR